MTVALVCGGRDYVDMRTAFAALDAYHASYPITLVVEGGARGADRLGREWAIARGIPFTTVSADWATHGKAAGFIRNQQMIDLHHPQICVAFPGGRGTADMTRRCQRVNIPVWSVPS